jgi:hypothetical protein
MPSEFKSKSSRRKVLPGFPKTDKFKTIHEVRAYLDRDYKIQCLLCGKWYKALGHHVVRIHDTTPDEYREMFGMPYGYGLVSKTTKNNYSVSVKARISDPKERESLLGRLEKGRATLAESPPTPRYSTTDRKRRSDRGKAFAKTRRNTCTYTKEKADLFLKKLKEIGVTTKVLKLGIDGIPSSASVLYGWFKRHPEFKNRYLKVVDRMSIRLKAKREGLDDDFGAKCLNLVDTGFNQKQVAEILGVAQMTVCRHAARARKNHLRISKSKK